MLLLMEIVDLGRLRCYLDMAKKDGLLSVESWIERDIYRERGGSL